MNINRLYDPSLNETQLKGRLWRQQLYHISPNVTAVDDDSGSDSASSSSSADSSSSPYEPVTPGITVCYSETLPEKHPPVYAYALKVEVKSAVEYPSHLFVFQRSKANEIGDWTDEFIQIASPVDVEEVPENAPDLARGMPYYRAREVTLWFRCRDDLLLAKEKIRADIITFTKTYDIIDNEFDKQEYERYE